MKNKLFSFTAIILITFFFNSNNFKNSNSIAEKDTQSLKLCGAWYNFYNSSTYTITQITVQRLGSSSLVYNNPSFPFSAFDDIPGNKTIIVKFASGATIGTIIVTRAHDGSSVTCEPYEDPYTVPVAFDAGCFSNNISITNNEYCN